MPVPSATSAACETPRAAPKRASASSAPFTSLSTTTGSPSRSLITSRKRTSASGRWVDQCDTPVSHSTSAGIPKPTASTSGAAARASSTDSTKMSSVSARSPPRQVLCTR